MKGRNQPLPEHELRAILRAAVDIIAQGGRALLSKILKGSKDRKLMMRNGNSYCRNGAKRCFPFRSIRSFWHAGNAAVPSCLMKRTPRYYTSDGLCFPKEFRRKLHGITNY
ncbi:hypothetical protein AMQ83_27385 [Paenibacillus riograndensis]|nr:hypothetical protein AMQ83_27385 [Paenibacillus riograndensis]